MEKIKNPITADDLDKMAGASVGFVKVVYDIIGEGLDPDGENKLATGIMTTAMVALFAMTDDSDDAHAGMAMRLAEAMPQIANAARLAIGRTPLFEIVADDAEDTE